MASLPIRLAPRPVFDCVRQRGADVITMRQVVAIIFNDPDSGFAVTFPDLPGCVAFATMLKEVLAARGALRRADLRSDYDGVQ